VSILPRRILIITNAADIEIGALTTELLASDYEIQAISGAPEARDYIERQGLPHLMVIDLRLDGAGELARDMYEAAGMPIITVAPNGGADAAVEALRYADDFVRQEYASAPELAMRIRRVLSRIQNFSYATGPEIKISDWLSVDHINRQVTVRGEIRKLTPTENALLNVLLTHRGAIVDADTLIERVWRLDPSIKDRNALRVHIHRLRNKIENDPDAPQFILTERGIGYSFAEDAVNN
jgi:DNA-binding response OmpR family regulator